MIKRKEIKTKKKDEINKKDFNETKLKFN